MKKFLPIFLLAAAMLSIPVTAAEDITLTINNAKAEYDTPPQIIDGRTMVPVRAIFESVGAEVSWDNNTKTVTGVKNGTTVVMTIGSNEELINGEKFTMDCAPQIIDGRTLAPARYVAEAFGCEVEWNGDTKTVNIVISESNTYEASEESTTETENYDDWIEYLASEDMRPNAISYKAIGDDELTVVHENARYNFEQAQMPQALFEDDGTLAKLIKSDPDGFTDKITDIWYDNAASYIVVYMTETSKRTFTINKDGDLDKYIAEIADEALLNIEDNMSASMTKMGSDKYITLLEMADDEYLAACSYIAIVYGDDIGFNYYTLEKSLDGYYAVCKITKNGRSTLSTLSAEENALKKAFLKEIDALLNK